MVVRHHDAGQTVFSLIGIKPGRVHENVSAIYERPKIHSPQRFVTAARLTGGGLRQYDAPAEKLKPDPDQFNH